MTNDDQATGKIVRATIFGGAGRVVNALVSLWILTLLTRHLQLDELGRFALWGFLLTVLDQLTDFGSGNLVLQRGARDDWAFTSYLAGARRLRTRAFFVGWVVAALAVLLVEHEDRGWLLLALASPCTRRLEASVLVLQRRVAWEIPVAIRSLAALARGTGVWLLVRGDVASAGPLLAWIGLANSASHVALHLAARRSLPRPTIGVALPRDLFRAAWPLAIAGLVQLAHVQVDYVFVRGISGEDELARYHVAARVFSYLVWVPVIATQAALPVLARARAGGALADKLERLGLPTALLGAVLLGAATPFCESLLVRCFGAPFAASAPALRVLLIAASVQWFQAWWVTGLIAANRGRALLVGSGLALGVNVLANALLVPAHGGLGAAWATTVSEVVLGSIAFGVLAAERSLRLRVLPACVAGGVLFYVARWLGSTL